MKRLTSVFITLALALTLGSIVQAAPMRHRMARRAVVDRDSFSVARSHLILAPHPRAWWIAHYPHTRFVLFAGGYYYWWGGYWFPAYGYDPAYSVYPYGEPIYGYNNYALGQVITNVQVALRSQGFYRGSIDGLVGPQTRAALRQYQRTHGLVVTGAIDQPTLATLGLA